MSCDGTRPEALSREIGMSAKVLRGWLCQDFPRSPAEDAQPLLCRATLGQTSYQPLLRPSISNRSKPELLIGVGVIAHVGHE